MNEKNNVEVELLQTLSSLVEIAKERQNQSDSPTLPSSNKQPHKEDTIFMNILNGVLMGLIGVGIISLITLYARVGIIETKIEKIEKLDQKVIQLEVQISTIKERTIISESKIENIKDKMNMLHPNTK